VSPFSCIGKEGVTALVADADQIPFDDDDDAPRPFFFRGWKKRCSRFSS